MLKQVNKIKANFEALLQKKIIMFDVKLENYRGGRARDFSQF